VTVAAIRAAWIEHGVLFFRDQDLTDGEHSKFCARFGVIQAERTAPESESEEHPGCLFVSNFKEGAILPDGEMWFHSDQCYFDLPVSAASLYAIEIPKEGGHTLFCDCYAPYESLSDDIRQRLDGLRALNVYDYLSNNRYMKTTLRAADARTAIHPVVRTHPESGRKSLFINRLMTDCIVGMDEAESTALLEMLFDHIEQPKHVYDHAWRPGDVALWDNRCTLHARTHFEPTERRLLRRYALEGDRPV
jgi:taurine dioxygenase